MKGRTYKILHTITNFIKTEQQMSIKGYKYMIESFQDRFENGKKKEKEPKDNANWTNNSFHLLSLLVKTF